MCWCTSWALGLALGCVVTAVSDGGWHVLVLALSLNTVIGVFLADTCWGTYKTIVVFLLVYTVVSCTRKVVIYIPIYRL
jgi:hypothetical protein